MNNAKSMQRDLLLADPSLRLGAGRGSWGESLKEREGLGANPWQQSIVDAVKG